MILTIKTLFEEGRGPRQAAVVELPSSLSGREEKVLLFILFGRDEATLTGSFRTGGVQPENKGVLEVL